LAYNLQGIQHQQVHEAATLQAGSYRSKDDASSAEGDAFAMPIY
jgi:hypothetical protein